MSKTTYPTKYSPQLLESIPCDPQDDGWISIICTEFTSLCPKTGQPDFARIYINYIAKGLMLESKSLKLYLFSFRNCGEYHESCVKNIAQELNKLLTPRYLEVIGEFTPRGGITIHPYISIANSEDTYQKLKEQRQSQYAPGRYTLPLQRIY
ncbi:MAG: preQ(1) synthase [Bdellovibrionales bacterium]|jgi:7-cyano-7-deazaguanine reductase|nr:preQ(1) synthase [Bdellovibrionales bacterium]MBT3527294.1 preQ(1) synthase [Bdellovibrionales bacterium]MBT7766346.1 preQ(1) synthase [Bdellovibrionales bacterium]